MSVIRRLDLRHHAPDLPHPDVPAIRAFLGAFHRVGVLPAGTRLFRYGLQLARTGSGNGAWIALTESRLESGDEALRYCAAPDPEPAEGESPEGAPPRPADTPIRETFEATADVPVWVGTSGVLARRSDLTRGALRPVGVPVPLARMRPLR